MTTTRLTADGVTITRKTSGAAGTHVPCPRSRVRRRSRLAARLGLTAAVMPRRFARFAAATWVCGNRMFRAASMLIEGSAAESGYGPRAGELDRVESDYHRFRNYPRD